MRRVLLPLLLVLVVVSPVRADTITIDGATPWTPPQPWQQGGGRYSYFTVGDFTITGVGIWFFKESLGGVQAVDHYGMLVTRTDGQPFTPVSASYFQSQPGPSVFNLAGNGFFATSVERPPVGPTLVLPTDTFAGLAEFSGPEWVGIPSLFFGFANFTNPLGYVSGAAHLSLRSLTVQAPAAVPEPAAVPLLAAGLIAAIARRGWRRRSSANASEGNAPSMP